MDVVMLILPAQASMSVKAVWPMAAVASMSTVFPAASNQKRYFKQYLYFIVITLMFEFLFLKSVNHSKSKYVGKTFL